MIINLTTENETENLAKALAECAHVGEVILLFGDLGVGKSTFARAFIRALTSENEDVPSPTFTLVQTYTALRFPLWHFDLYRLESPEEIWELGLEEISEGVALIEWPEKMGHHIPKESLHLTFEYGEKEGERRLQIEAPLSWHKRIETLTQT
ncbi:tRNA (adenosine(37)-N6)-threonylcarbamoyltransferase complex ATPase subunit type 1 TsaE [Candidatus Bealeia paramacronuclearis]|uniref:tRNA threonylcarbamoyladenosine biosynthesis protein TsaE n=1 Tax=Candidatus Bealeia paramacronuclearis TaxID=1921001 RepID=A0ABZ2C5L4_9PROT|nr:tRNA (adenosine(37)-N6)-threonylcarbamoyltransferase complex ATPase subunit type 1 TsaE [Candidatus Bealeia paramacronuclearis]